VAETTYFKNIWETNSTNGGGGENSQKILLEAIPFKKGMTRRKSKKGRVCGLNGGETGKRLITSERTKILRCRGSGTTGSKKLGIEKTIPLSG